MPKKTKKQKMLADKRHINFSPVSEEYVKPSPDSPSSTFQFQMTASAAKRLHDAESPEELAVIRHDLVRTILFAAIAIGTEFVLYWRFYK